MEPDDIKEYIKKLKELENSLGENETSVDDEQFVTELDGLLNSLSKDIQSTYDTVDIKVPVKIKKLDPNAVIPKYATIGDAGMDLTAISVSNEGDYISYKTGIAMEIPNGYVGLLFPRSSNSKKDLILSNSVGIIDSGYRGEIELRFKFLYKNSKIYNIGDRVGQILILPYPKIEFIETDQLSETERNDGGFGHTGI